MNFKNVPILKRLYPSIVRRYLMLIGKFKINIRSRVVHVLVFLWDLKKLILMIDKIDYIFI